MPPSEPSSPNLPDLTHKQREVLALVADNRTSKEIAARLGISESAVNQRIESVRARLGGIPRGELARLFRQEQDSHTAEADEETPPEPQAWQNIHLPPAAAHGDGLVTEGIPPASSVRPSPAGEAGRNGSQPSASLPPAPTPVMEPGSAVHQGLGASLAQASFFLAMLVIAMAIAAAVTTLIGPSIAGN